MARTTTLTGDRIERIESQIKEARKEVHFFLNEITASELVDWFEKDQIIIPDYQRDFVWESPRTGRFMESLIMNMPIPPLFLAQCPDGKYEIVDGTQRVRTIVSYFNNKFPLSQLAKLSYLQGFKFEHLPPKAAELLQHAPVRYFLLDGKTKWEAKVDIFSRVNRGSAILADMELRKGACPGPFTDFIYEDCMALPVVQKLLKVESQIRQEREHFLLQFFALIDQHPDYKFNPLQRILDLYLAKQNEIFKSKQRKQKLKCLETVFNFVDQIFPHTGFRIEPTSKTARVAYFHAISMGTYLALQEKKKLRPEKMVFRDILNNTELKDNISNSPDHLQRRIEIMKTEILNACG